MVDDVTTTLLTPREREAYELLRRADGRIVTRGELLRVGRDQPAAADAVKYLIGRIRPRIAPDIIEMVPGVGYRLAPRSGYTPMRAEGEVLRIGAVTVDVPAHRVTVDGELVHLARQAHSLLVLGMRGSPEL